MTNKETARFMTKYAKKARELFPLKRMTIRNDRSRDVATLPRQAAKNYARELFRSWREKRGKKNTKEIENITQQIESLSRRREALRKEIMVMASVDVDHIPSDDEDDQDDDEIPETQEDDSESQDEE